MHPNLRLAAALLVMTVTVACARTPSSGDDPRDARLAAEILGLHIDREHAVTIGDLTLQRDAGVLQLSGGTVYFCAPVGGRTVAAVYVGDGIIHYTPPVPVEQAQLHRFFNVDRIDEPISSAVLFFCDRTAAQIAAAGSPGAKGPLDRAQSALDESLELIADKEHRAIAPEVMRALLNGDTNDLFFARVVGTARGPLVFEINPYDAEPVSFSRKAHGGAHGVDLICQTRRQDDYLAATSSAPPRQIAVGSYVIDVTIDDDLLVRARADLGVTASIDGQRWVSFLLAPQIEVDSVTWNGEPAQTIGGVRGSGIVWVRTPAHFEKGATSRLSMDYQGKLIRRYVDILLLEETNSWYPRYDESNRATFDVTYHWPSSFRLLSSGARTSESVDGDVTTSHWVQERPSRFASFNLGFFKPMTITNDTLPPVTIYRHIDEAASLAEQVQWDVEESLRFFTSLFGRPPVSEFNVSSYPAGHGEAFPGLVHLSSMTFSGNNGSGFEEMFRSHEVAHQWWGLGVDPLTYHDWWLAEGFAEYSGMMFMHAVLKNPKRFFGALRDYRDAIIDNRSSLFGKGQEAGPIWLGYRNATSTTDGDYWLIIYKKGAWVLHMLRSMMMDPNTLSDERFTAMMRDFYATYSKSGATTEDFQRTVEKHAGTKMDWFFDQWVYGTAIPTYRFSYSTTTTTDGKTMLKCRVDASGVPAGFKSYPMVTIDFGDNRLVRGRRPVQGARTEFEFLLPAKPEKVIFNDYESVLCKVEEVDWE